MPIFVDTTQTLHRRNISISHYFIISAHDVTRETLVYADNSGIGF